MPDPRPNFQTDPIVAAVSRRMMTLPIERGGYLDMAIYHARAAAEWMEREKEGLPWAAEAVEAELVLGQSCYKLHQQDAAARKP